MPPRPLSLDLRRRSSYVCKACLAGLRSVNSVRPWLARPSSSAARNPQPPSAGPPKPQSPPSAADLEREFAEDHQRVAHQKTQATPGAADPTRPLAEEAGRDGRSSSPPESSGEPQDAAPSSAEMERFFEQLDRAGPSPSAEPLDVKFFDQEAPGQLRRLRDDDEFGEVSGGLDAEVANAINNLEKEMINTVRMLQRMEKQGEADKAEQLRKQFKKTLRLQYKGKTGPEAERYGLLRITGFSGSGQRHVANLNRFLARDTLVMGGTPKPKDVAECWKYYSAARGVLSTAWEKVPREMWEFLWWILSWEGEGVENPNRMRHIYYLTKDMQAAGIVLRDSQQLLAIEAMFIEGWQDEAIEAWKKAVVTLGSKPETFKPYWELGVRMCALHGDTERARKAADTLLGSSHPVDPRILLPVIRAQAAREATVDGAWDSYRSMRDHLGENIKIEDYDEVIAIFLTSDWVEYALQVFVDMMFSGSIDIRGRAQLPVAVGNFFFIGKWLKRLIGLGDLDGAYKVVVYAQSKGIKPPPIQLNGLIGAWLRSGTAENVERAERLAWSMIAVRLDHVEKRRRQAAVRFYDPYRPAAAQPEQDAARSRDAHRPSATEQAAARSRDAHRPSATKQAADQPGFVCQTKATVETFSLLAENYCSRRLHGRLQELFGVLRQAEIVPTSFIMNQVIRSYSQNGEADEAVNMYRTMTREQGIRPDGHTFLTLFNTLSVNRLIVHHPELYRKDILLGREFFRDMVQAEWTFDSPEIFAQLPRTILFSMLKTKDFSGMIVAARAMRELFAFHPPQSLLIELAAGAGALQTKTRRHIERLVVGTKQVEKLIQMHRKELMEKGRKGGEMTGEAQVDELDAVLEKVVLLKAGAQHVTADVVQSGLEETAREMGVYEIAMLKDAALIDRHRKLAKKRDRAV